LGYQPVTTEADFTIDLLGFSIVSRRIALTAAQQELRLVELAPRCILYPLANYLMLNDV